MLIACSEAPPPPPPRRDVEVPQLSMAQDEETAGKDEPEDGTWKCCLIAIDADEPLQKHRPHLRLEYLISPG
jgi:hypothetical protein